MTDAARAERGAWDHGNALFSKEALGEDLVGEAGGANVGEGVEGALWCAGRQVEGGEAIKHDGATSRIGGAHLFECWFTVGERLEGGILRNCWGAHDRVLVNLDQTRNDLLRGAEEADAPPRHRVRL